MQKRASADWAAKSFVMYGNGGGIGV